MFLVYGSVGVTKLRPNADGSFATVWDRVLAPPASANYKQAAEGMRVLYDAAARQYVVSHTVIIDLAGGQFEFGLSAFDQDAGDLKWTHAFPAASSGYTGTASHPYALAMGRGAQGGAVYAIGGLAVPSDEAVNDPVGRLLTVSPDGAVVFDKRFQLKPSYNIE